MITLPNDGGEARLRPLPYVRNTNGSINVSEHSLEKFVRQDASRVVKTE